jgi:hypothetical protein
MFIDLLTVFVPGLVLTALVLAGVATRRVRGDESFTADQRVAQLWLVWLLPLAGPVLVLSMLHDEPHSGSHRDTSSSQSNG